MDKAERRKHGVDEYRRRQVKKILEAAGYRETYPGSGEYVQISLEVLKRIVRPSKQATKAESS